MLAVVAAKEMGAGRVVVAGAPEEPRLALCRRFGAEALIDIAGKTPERRIAEVREAQMLSRARAMRCLKATIVPNVGIVD